jgi:hypothetical protein
MAKPKKIKNKKPKRVIKDFKLLKDYWINGQAVYEEK